MGMCPLCADRAAKRFCPAKEDQICPVCCGTKREIEIDCPSDCVHLKAGRAYEAEKRVPDPELAAKLHKFNDAFLREYSGILDLLSRAVATEYLNSQWLLDNDVIEVFKALTATLKTLSSGIHFDYQPDGPVRQSLFRNVKVLLDELMHPQEAADRRAMKVAEAIEITEFLTFAAQIHSNARPKSRQYLHWLESMATQARVAEQPAGLIIPS